MSLSACPFCGGRAEYKAGIKTGYVMCLKCEVMGPNIAQEDAVTAWNARFLGSRSDAFIDARIEYIKGNGNPSREELAAFHDGYKAACVVPELRTINAAGATAAGSESVVPSGILPVDAAPAAPTKKKVLSLINRICHYEGEFFRGRCPVGGANGEQGKAIDELLALCLAPVSAIRNTTEDKT